MTQMNARLPGLAGRGHGAAAQRYGHGRRVGLIAAAFLIATALRIPAATPGAMPFVGGMGGAYFLAEPGELVIEVEKRDLNRREVRTELRAILVGPGRTVLQEAGIADDGKPRGSGLGPIQSCRLATRVAQKGVYGLNITVSQDRYGEETVWRFRSNCPKYLIETARGHRDARHEEPIVLASPGEAAEVCFSPRPEAFAIELARLPAGTAPPLLLDSQGETVATLAVDASGRARREFTPAASRGTTPWRLRLPSAQATVSIDGLTRWDRGDRLPDACLWTPDPTSWFPLIENRWLLTPYQQQRFGPPGERTLLAFEVRNGSTRARTLQLGIEFADTTWPAELSANRVTVAAGAARTITVSAAVPAAGERRSARLRVTPADDASFTTFSSFTVIAGEAPADRPLPMPIVLKAYAHENEQFGYAPDYPLENQIYFDPRNQPFVRTASGVATRQGGRWSTHVVDARSSAASTKVSFDRDGRVYVLGTVDGNPALYTSSDGGRTFVATPIPAGRRSARSFDLEVFTGHNPLSAPPAIVRYTMTAKDEKLFWRSLNDLELFVPRIENGRVVLGQPILVTRQCIGFSAHSGAPASVVSTQDKVHVVWGDATDPSIKVPGVPVRAATFDRASGRLGEAALLGYGAPANDIHNTPSITRDGSGYLHALGGTHGRPFPYARSLRPDDAAAGWTEAVPAGEAAGQTYVGLVCGPDGTLHAAFRLWRSQVEPFPASSHATLAYQRKRPGQPWEPPRVLVVSPFSEYSVFYHRLTIDRRGRLFLSYDYWSTFWFYRNDLPARRRTLLLSPDGGESWKLAANADFN